MKVILPVRGVCHLSATDTHTWRDEKLVVGGSGKCIEGSLM